MNEKTYEKIKKHGLQLFPCNVVISTCDGTKHKALGYVNVPYIVRKVKRIIPTLVVKQMEAELILGMDFWNAFRIKPCFTSNSYGIKVLSSESLFIGDPNEDNNCTEINFESDITPPKCLNVELPYELSTNEKKKLEKVIQLFPFCSKEGELNKTHLKKAKIDTGDANPVRCKMRLEPPWKLKKIIEEIDRLEQRGIIRKVESSTWLQPLMAVPKTNGKWRIPLTMPSAPENLPTKAPSTSSEKSKSEESKKPNKSRGKMRAFRKAMLQAIKSLDSSSDSD